MDTPERHFFDLSPDFLALAAVSGDVVQRNPAWLKLLGTAPLVGLVHPEDRAFATAALADAGPRRFECRVRGQDGAYRRVAWDVRRQDGHIYYMGRDVGARVQAERRLAESDARWKALVEGSIEAIVIERLPTGGPPLFVNAAAARLYGFAGVDELLAAAPPVPPLATHGAGFHGRLELRRRDGTSAWVEALASRVTWEGLPAMQLTLVDVSERVRLEDELARHTSTDALTGLCNRRRFGERATRELRRAMRHPEPLALLVVDADHFKGINDRYGHAAGDRVLARLGEILRGAVRDLDHVCRWGGEEFVLLLVGANATRARQVGERIRQSCNAAIEHAGRSIELTVSIGVTERRASELVLEPMVARADRALATAKAAGRNRVHVA